MPGADMSELVRVLRAAARSIRNGGLEAGSATAGAAGAIGWHAQVPSELMYLICTFVHA